MISAKCCGALGMWRDPTVGDATTELGNSINFFRGRSTLVFGGSFGVLFFILGVKSFERGEGGDFFFCGRDPVVLADLEILNPNFVLDLGMLWARFQFCLGIYKARWYVQTCDLGPRKDRPLRIFSKR